MVGLEEQSEVFLSNLKERYKKIYNILSTCYDPNEPIHSEEGFDPHLTKIALIIEKEYGIRRNLVLQDYKYKIKSLGLLSDVILPTFFMRFAIEEGAWTVIERVIARELLLEKFGKLIDLENQIWKEKSANPEDAIFYLLELQDLGKTYIREILEYWRLDHGLSDIRKFLNYFAAVLVNTYINRGHEIVEGAIRILHSKTRDFIDVRKGEFTTNWFTSALEYVDRLSEDLGNYDEERIVSSELMEAIIVQIILQTEIRKTKRGMSLTQDEFQRKKAVLETLNWQGFDPEDPDQVKDFENNTLAALLLIEGEAPMTQVDELLEILFKSEKIKKSMSKYRMLIEKEVELQRGLSASSMLPQQILVASTTKKALDKVLIQLKKDCLSEDNPRS